MILFLFAVLCLALGICAIVAAQHMVDVEQRRTDAAELRALLAQGEADAYKGALLLSRVDNFRLDWEAPTVKPIEATPVYARLMDRRASFDRDLRLIRDLPETPGGEGA